MHQTPTNLLRSWTRDVIDTVPKGTVLPADRDLASKFGLSLATVRRVLRLFSTQGALVRGSGRPTRTAAPGVTMPHRPTAAQTGLSHERTAGLLYRQICEGTLKAGHAVPQAKRLSAEWRVSSATVTSACRLLCQRGILSKVGKSYLVGTASQLLPRGPEKKVFAFEPAGMSMEYLYGSHPMALAYQAMEFELLRERCHMTYVPRSAANTLIAEWIRNNRAPHGLFFAYVDESLDRLAQTLHLLSRSLGSACPRSLLCGKFTRVRAVPRVCYLSHGHMNTEWLRALAEYVATRRYARVNVYCDTRGLPMSNASLLKFWVELRHSAPAIPIRYVLCHSVPSPRTPQQRLAAFCHRPASHALSILNKYTPTSQADVAGVLVDVPSLDSALKESRPGDAWIFRGQDTAVDSRCRLHALGISDVAVISLENAPRHFTSGVTACVPDTYTIGYQMAHAIIGDFPVARSHRGYMKTPVVVLERT
jgi:DNA-binding transcriptional regulator YhcF (GntR family)